MCGRTCLKILIGIINAIFLLAGGLMLAFGIVALVKPGLIIELVTDNDNFLENIGDIQGFEGLLKGVGIFMIVLGGVVFVFAFFGLVGACCENNCMLIIFVILLFIILLAEIALILVGAFSEDILKSSIQDGVYEFIRDRFEGSLSIENNTAIFKEDKVGSSTWESFQIFFKCCGIKSYMDYNNATAWKREVIVNQMTEKDPAVPLSCCKIKSDDDFVKPNDVKEESFESITNCMDGLPAGINGENCYTKTTSLIEDYAKIAIGIAAGICGLEIIMIILTIILIVLIRNHKGSVV